MAEENGGNTPMSTEDTPMRTEDDSAPGSDSDSGSEEGEVEWMVTSRQKRTTAGNRLSTLIQQEEPDELLELLFEEAEDDAVFQDDDADASDVQMESSDDDEDQGPAAAADDFEGEKELQRQAKAERQAKKRKLNDGIPKIFKKRVKIDPTVSQSSAPRPKKKSERASWIPTAEDAPTRASARGTTRQSKEQLHAQMIDREVKRLKQLENMEKAAAAKEAKKKPALTQTDRLAEAARVEKSNSKSLSRWEESEQQREEEQRAKLAALKNRHLDGPVMTWWSGLGEWVGGKLRQVGKALVIGEPKEKPATKKRKAAEMEAESESKATVVETGPSMPNGTSTKPESPAVPNGTSTKPESPSVPNGVVVLEGTSPPPNGPTQTPKNEPPAPNATPTPAAEPAQNGVVSSTAAPTVPNACPTPQPGQNSSLIPKGDSPQQTVVPQNPSPPQISNPTPPTPPMSSVLAPPPGLPTSAPYPPPQMGSSQPYRPFTLAPPRLDGSAPLPGFGYNQPQPPRLMPSSTTPFSFAPSQPPPPQPVLPPPPPAIEHAARNYLILSNFDEVAIKDKQVQTEIIFGRKFVKCPSKYLFSFDICSPLTFSQNRNPTNSAR
jgi:vacuolar protein sorting-associated protein 72